MKMPSPNFEFMSGNDIPDYIRRFLTCFKNETTCIKSNYCFFFQFLQVLLRVSLRLALGVYGVMSLVCVVFTMMLPIETKGRPMVVRFLRSLLLLLVLLFELLLLQTGFTAEKLSCRLSSTEKIYSDELQIYSALQCNRL